MTPSFRLVSKRVRRGSRQEAALRALCRKNLSGSATNGGTYIDAGPAYASGFSNRQGEIGPLRVLTLHEDRSGRARTQSSPTVVGPRADSAYARDKLSSTLTISSGIGASHVTISPVRGWRNSMCAACSAWRV